ncbi:scavenger receptor class B member 1-like [Anopheles ziemanni]|uniref:scavenger receptor class B member 1-like n=1 Tax=Anopheles coustani TaxID=139045 RepID=UPI0026598F6F|nr:scavenger receptor class B member 1-like [Anopheles coustani]XP_058178349.1 scavenger receptor class B member 1-like [Anopheles ziemanni]
MWWTNMYNESVLENLILRPNATATEWWAKPPVYPLLKVHIFNYTNTKEFLAGVDSKLKVKDLGPYVYKETAEKRNVVHNTDGTISYRDYRYIQYEPLESDGKPFDQVVVPNVVFLSAVAKKRSETYWSNMMFNTAAIGLGAAPFMTLPADSFIWGYEDSLLGLAKTFFTDGIDSTTFGMLMSRNGTSAENFTIFSGESSLQDLAIIKQMDGKSRLDLWHTDECDLVGGTDGTQFPPHLMEGRQTLQVFIKSLCRKFPLVYDSEVTALDGIPAWRYKIPTTVFAHPDKHKPNHCFCHLQSGACPPSGLFNVSGCSMGAPIFASFPHFYTGDRQLIDSVEGLEPVQELHESYADIHPRLAFPIDGASRFQINIQVQKASGITGLEKFQDGLYLPVLWLEVVPGVISEELRSMIYHSTYSANAIQMSLRVASLVFFVLSLVMLLARFYCCSKVTNSMKRDEQERHSAQVRYEEKAQEPTQVVCENKLEQIKQQDSKPEQNQNTLYPTLTTH